MEVRLISPAAQQTTEHKTLSRFLKACQPRELRPIIEWAESEVVLPSGPYRGYNFEADRLPYSRLLLSELGKWNRHIVNGPTQSGKSFHAFVMIVMYYLFEMQEDVIVGVPDSNMAGAKWSKDIKPAIASSSYAHLLPTKGQGSKDGARVQEVKFGNGATLTFMGGGGGDNQRAGATTKVLAVTEANKFDVVADSSQEGQSKIQQLEARTNAYADEALMFFECTNTTEDAFIWAEYQAGTCSKIVHKCRSCEQWVSPEREHLIGWQDAVDEIEAAEKACFICPECGIHYSEQDRIEMNADAKLLHKGQEITPDGEIVGSPPRTRKLGFRWSAFQNLLCSTEYIAVKEWRAANSEDPETAEIAVKQQVWAIPAKVDNVEKTDLTAGIIRGSDTNYRGRVTGSNRGEIPPDTQCVTAAIDIGLRFHSWSVCAHIHGQSHRSDYGFHETPMPDVVGEETAIKSGLNELLKRLDSDYDIAIGLVDCGNWPDWVIETVLAFEGRGLWLPSRGVPRYVHPYSDEQKKTKIPPEHSQDQWYYDPVRGVVNFNPDWWKHRVHARWMVKPGNQQFCSLFGTDPREHNEFAKQLLAEEFRRELTRNGNVKETWFKVHRDNHQFDCEVLHLVGRSYVREQHHLASQPQAPLVLNSGDAHFDSRF